MSNGPLATIDDVQARINGTLDEGEYVRVNALLVDASAAVRMTTGQTISRATTTERLPVYGGSLRLPQKPVVSVTSITRVSDSSSVTFVWDGLQRVTFGSSLLDGFERDLVLGTGAVVIDLEYEHGYAEGEIPDPIVAIVCNAAMRSHGAPAEDAGLTSESLGSYAEGRSVTMQERAAAGAVSLLEDELRILQQFKLPAEPITTVWS